MKTGIRIGGLLLVGVCVLALFGDDCRAGSIYAKRSQNSKPFYSDDKAYRIGDVLTIIIVEDHKVDNKVERDLERQSSRLIELGSSTSRWSTSFRAYERQTEDRFEQVAGGWADYRMSHRGPITVVVQDIHPNGIWWY